MSRKVNFNPVSGKSRWSVCLGLCCMLACLAACNHEPEAAKPSVVRTDGERIIFGSPEKAAFLKISTVDRDQGEILALPGRIVWSEERTVRVFPQVGGRIQRIGVDLGEEVKAGTALAWLASPDYGQAQADAVRAEAAYRLAKQGLERSRELREAGVIAEKDWQQAEADAAAARAEQERASKRLGTLGGAADAYVLKAPVAGTVVERNVNPGMEFRPDAGAPPLFVLTDPRRLWLQLDANEVDLAHLRVGEPLQLSVRQYPGERFKGCIVKIADFVDPTTRTVRIRGEVANADRRLKGEMFVKAEIQLPPTHNLHVPTAAVFLQGDKRFVFVEEQAGVFRRQEVTVLGDRDGMADVSAGLKEGERVVSEGSLSLVKYLGANPQQGDK